MNLLRFQRIAVEVSNFVPSDDSQRQGAPLFLLLRSNLDLHFSAGIRKSLIHIQS